MDYRNTFGSPKVAQVNDNSVIGFEVLTPLHIGGSADKHWRNKIDFFYDAGLLYRVDSPKLYQILSEKQIDFGVYADSIIADEAIETFLFETWKIARQDIAHAILTIPFTPDEEVKALIRNGLGQVFIPGSSLKGALRSIIFHHLYFLHLDKSQSIPAGKEEKFIFGEIHENLMRLLRVTDSESLAPLAMAIYKSKVMSRDAKQEIHWKTSENAASPKFDTTHFTTTFECIDKGNIGMVRIGFMDVLRQYGRLAAPNAAHLLTANPIKTLFSWINDYTLTYLKAEIDYFNHKATVESSKMSEYLTTLRNQVQQAIQGGNQEAILRMSSGSGAHAITGNWENPSNHIASLNNPVTEYKDIKKGVLKKTRRVLLSGAGLNELLPMGFIKLYDEASWSKHQAQLAGQQQEKHQSKRTQQQQLLHEINAKKQALEAAATAAKLPKYAVTFKVGQTIDAQYIRNEKGKAASKVFKLLVIGEGKEQEVVLTYHSDLVLNEYYKVKILSVQKTKKGIFIQTIQKEVHL